MMMIVAGRFDFGRAQESRLRWRTPKSQQRRAPTESSVNS
jgi:hypothetical protein